MELIPSGPGTQRGVQKKLALMRGKSADNGKIRGDPEFYRNGLVTYSFFEQRNKSSTGDLAAASSVGPACDSGHAL